MPPVTVDIDNLCPWELAIKLNGTLHATVAPTWGDVILLADVERKLRDLRNDAEQAAAFEQTLRGAVKRFMPQAAHGDVDAASWDKLLGAFVACSEYYSVFLAKKKQTAIEAVSPPAPPKPAAAAPRGKPSSPSPG